jgi:flagellar biosynthesis protein FlhG
MSVQVAAEPLERPHLAERRPEVITVASGKGGVGKTQVAVNLAYLMAQAGERVLLIDGDLGLANTNLLLGLSSAHHAGHVLSGRMSMSRAVVSFEGLFDLLPAGSAISDLAELTLQQQVQLLEALDLRRQPYDRVIIDAGAGIGSNVRLALALADTTIVVMNPETTSLTDAYALVKVAGVHGSGGRFRVVVNRVTLAEQAREMFGCLNSACQSFLGVDLDYAGYIYSDQVVERAARDQRPFVQSFPASAASRCLETLSRRLMEESSARTAE